MVGILRHSPHIKVCVASRPWTEFETAFALNLAWMLCVHDLTRDDIHLYTAEIFGNDLIFQQLRKMDDRCPDLVEDVIKTAEGVFLWVFLVVRSLLEGLSNADQISDPQKRLSQLQPTLSRTLKGFCTVSMNDTKSKCRPHSLLLSELASYCPYSPIGRWMKTLPTTTSLTWKLKHPHLVRLGIFPLTT